LASLIVVAAIAIAVASGAIGVVLIGLAIFFVLRKQKQSGKESGRSVGVKIHPEMVQDSKMMKEAEAIHPDKKQRLSIPKW
jgi:hypothetical protein